MASFKVGDSEYQSKLFDGAKQIFVMKRLLPAFAALTGVAQSLKSEDGVAPSLDRIAVALQPVTEALSRLSDEDVDYIFTACFEVTSRRIRVGTGWMPVMTNGQFPDDYDSAFAVRLQIAWNVISENFAQMFASFGLDLPGLEAKAFH